LDFGLSVTDLRKSFTSPNGERIEVLGGVSFAAAAGEVVAIMGASGAGKSTLLHLLGGLEAADHGSIMAGQFAIDRATPPALARFRNQQVGFVFQFHDLLPDLTAAENVSFVMQCGAPCECSRKSDSTVVFQLPSWGIFPAASNSEWLFAGP
jgi:lipoprotein-releasing system ATP-binding protein